MALPDEARVGGPRELVGIDDGHAVRLDGDRALEEGVAPSTTNAVDTGAQAERAVLLARRDLADDGATDLAAHHQEARAVGHGQPAARLVGAEVGERDLVATAQVVVKRRVLGAGERAARRQDRLLARVAECLGDGDDLIVVGIGRAAQRGQEVVREERAPELVALLGVLTAVLAVSTIILRPGARPPTSARSAAPASRPSRA